VGFKAISSWIQLYSRSTTLLQLKRRTQEEIASISVEMLQRVQQKPSRTIPGMHTEERGHRLTRIIFPT